MNARVVLVTPPVAKACEPDPAVLALAGHLESVGIKAAVVDANLRFHQALYDPARLARHVAKIPSGTPAATSAQRAVAGAARAAARLATPAGYRTPGIYRGAVNALVEGGKLVSRALGVTLSLSDFHHPDLSPLSSADLAAVGREPERLPTHDALQGAVEEILSRAPAVVGLSLSYLSQALHGFALAGMLRRAGYKGLLLLGGGVVGAWGARLRPELPLFSLFDALVSGPGEEALTAAARTGRVPDLPGVLAPGAALWREEPVTRTRAVHFLPHVASLPWTEYLAPAPVLPLSASRGCYWARCAFCPEAAEGRQPYRSSPVAPLAAAILEARDRVGIRTVHFTDNALSPAHLSRIADALEGEGVSWYGFARVEPKLGDPAFLERLARGGCGMLQLGLESASPRLLAKMGKGSDTELAARVVEGAARAGIRVYGYFLFGLPTEREEEADATVAWIRERGEALTFLNLSLMNFPRGGEMEEDPARFGVGALSPLDQRNDLSLYWGFEDGEGAGRAGGRRALGRAKRDPVIRRALVRTPRGFSANHALFAPI